MTKSVIFSCSIFRRMKQVEKLTCNPTLLTDTRLIGVAVYFWIEPSPVATDRICFLFSKVFIWLNAGVMRVASSRSTKITKNNKLEHILHELSVDKRTKRSEIPVGLDGYFSFLCSAYVNPPGRTTH